MRKKSYFLFTHVQPARQQGSGFEIFWHFVELNNLIRRGKPNKPRPGSSKGKIGIKKVIGAAKVLKSLSFSVRTLQDIMRLDPKADTKALQKAFKSVRTQVTTNIG